MRHPSRRQFSHAQYFMKGMILAVFWDACCLSILALFQSALCQYEYVYLYHVCTHDSSFRGIWVWLNENRQTSAWKLVKKYCEGRWRRVRVIILSILALFDNTTRFTFHNSNQIPDLYCSFSQNKAMIPIRLKYYTMVNSTTTWKQLHGRIYWFVSTDSYGIYSQWNVSIIYIFWTIFNLRIFPITWS